MNIPEENTPVEPDIERAEHILQNEPQSVVNGIFRLLLSGGARAVLQDGNAQTALKIVATQVENYPKLVSIQCDAAERAASLKQKPLILGIGIVGTIAISYLFLHFNRPEFIVAVFTAAGGYVAGYGTANQRTRKQ